MNNTKVPLATVRAHAQSLLTSIGVSRIIVVDDQYRERDVEDLIGLCATLTPAQAAALPHLGNIDFRADQDIWIDLLRSRWTTLTSEERGSVLANANASQTEYSTRPEGHDGAGPRENRVDTRTATSLKELLVPLDECDCITLSLGEWREQRAGFLEDDQATHTVFLFDKDFSNEGAAEDEGISLLLEMQGATHGCCALLTHTVTAAGEDNARRELAAQYGLRPDAFVVIAKDRLTDESLDLYQFLRMLRFVGLSRRYANVKLATWKVFRESLQQAEIAVEGLSVADFDAIVFSSSRREGVWEPDTLFRLFGIFTRREARQRLRNAQSLVAEVSEARRISAVSEKLAKALGAREPTTEARRIQRFDSYESREELNQYHLPIDVGDIFEAVGNRRQYILLTQPCDLMVRTSGKRHYDWKCGRTGALVELVVSETKKKERWSELSWYDGVARGRTFVDFARVHQALLAVLDLCVFQPDGVAKIDVDVACPDWLIEPWRARYNRLARLFGDALRGYAELEEKELRTDLKLLALPRLSATVAQKANAEDRTVDYGLRRVSRLRQPRSGALLSAFAQYHARAAFEHPFEEEIQTQPTPSVSQESEGP